MYDGARLNSGVTVTMHEIIFVLHILAAVCLIALILVQHGKGADMGAAFGSGASQTVFGSIGSMPFLAKLTTVIAVIFCITSLALGYFIARQSKQEGTLASVVAATAQRTPSSSQSQQPSPNLHAAPTAKSAVSTVPTKK